MSSYTHHTHTRSNLFAKLRDGACITALPVLLYVSRHGMGSSVKDYLIGGLLAAFLFITLSEATPLYRTLINQKAGRILRSVLFAWLPTLTCIVTMGFLTKRSEVYSRILISLWTVLTPLLLTLLHALDQRVSRKAVKLGMRQMQAVVVGDSQLAVQVANQIIGTPELGIQFGGLFCDQTPKTPLPDGITVTGTLADAIEQAKSGALDIVYLATSNVDDPQVGKTIEKLADSTIDLYLVPRFETFDLFKSPVQMVGDMPALSLFDTPPRGVGGLVKRVEDICLSAILLPAAAIPMLMIAILVKATSRGPVFFRQTRYGIGGQPIRVLKFRSMHVCEDGAYVPQATRDDSRTTRVGRFLRRTSLDELPQLFNVLSGSMSLVGPRPHAVAHNEAYRKLIHGYMLRHKVKPGMTGLAQIRGFRGETDTLEKMEQRIQSDLEYIRTWSPSLDLKILACTPHALLSKQNAF